MVPCFTASLKFSINLFPLSIVNNFKSISGREILFFHLLKLFSRLLFNNLTLKKLNISQDIKGFLPKFNNIPTLPLFIPLALLGANAQTIAIDLSLLFLIVFAQARAKGAPPETPIIEKFLILSLFATSKTILGQSKILNFEIGSDIP